MGSHLFVCVRCLRQLRIVGYVAPDFDEVCDDCRAIEAPQEEPAAEPAPKGKAKPRSRTVG